MDEARRSAASSKKPSTGSSNASNAGKALVSSQADAPEIDDPEKCSSYEDEFLQSTAGTIISEDSEPRTGRWTAAETSYVDELIVKFGLGALPIPAGVKLHEFLASILLCKGSRLTKKMKNAKLSTKSYTRNTGYIADLEDAIEFSALEEAFFHSIPCAMERSAIKFHMQRQWREMFCRVCSDLSLPLKAESWLNSVEEVERRSSMAKVAARMKKRKQIVKQESATECMAASNAPKSFSNKKKNAVSYLSPFLSLVMDYIIDQSFPFEHIDLWVPIFRPVNYRFDQSCCTTYCTLVYGGCATASIESLKMFSFFGKYSEHFSFGIGCGIPGRIYASGAPVWYHNTHMASPNPFERAVGATRSGIRTILGIPVCVAIFSVVDAYF
jgi:hypothetical protein